MKFINKNHFSLTIALFLNLSLCFSQDSSYYYNGKENVKIEITKKGCVKSEYFSNKKILSKGRVMFAVVTDSTYAHEITSGNFKTELYTKLLDLYDGDYTKWYENGNIECKGKYHRGNKFGTWSYYNNSGALIKQENYSDEGYLSGNYLEYFTNGKLKTKGVYKIVNVPYEMNKTISHTVSMKEGAWEYYQLDGTLESKEQWKDNKLIK
jgi:antitoxin component YwqK of YwqJK toxin-antitoxin module